MQPETPRINKVRDERTALSIEIASYTVDCQPLARNGT